jgi:5-carboxymethyl-2-hydroxymuconate isomerase
MPHVIVEYSSNLPAFDIPTTLRTINAAIAAEFRSPEIDIKARMYRVDDFQIGALNEPAHAFVAVRLHTRNRDPISIKTVSDAVLQLIMTHIPGTPSLRIQYTVDVIPIDAHAYTKGVTHGSENPR